MTMYILKTLQYTFPHHMLTLNKKSNTHIAYFFQVSFRGGECYMIAHPSHVKSLDQNKSKPVL